MNRTHYLTYDTSDGVIWGCGQTPESALADAKDWHDRNGDGDESLAEFAGRLATEPATRELAETVISYGGRVAWTWGSTPDDRVMIEA